MDLKLKKGKEWESREEEEKQNIPQTSSIGNNNAVQRTHVQIYEDGGLSIWDVLGGLGYGFIVRAFGAALVEFLIAWAQAGFPNIEIWLDGEGALIATILLVIAGQIGGTIGAVMGLIITVASNSLFLYFKFLN
jgi:hypothetical protein